MQAIGEAKQKQTVKQMKNSLSLGCAKKLSEHEVLLAKLKSIVHESDLTMVEFIKRVFFGSQNGASFLVTFLRKKSNN